VEGGVATAATYPYDYGDGQVVRTADLARRGGVQPAIRVFANGPARRARS